MGERALRDQQSAPTQPTRLYINCSRLRGNTFQLLQENTPAVFYVLTQERTTLTTGKFFQRIPQMSFPRQLKAELCLSSGELVAASIIAFLSRAISWPGTT